MIGKSKTAKRPEKNPYEDAKGQLFEYVSSYAASAFHWRLAAIICLVILALSLSLNIMQASQAKVVPYVVAVDRIGQAVAVQRADEASVTPRSVIQAELANLVSNWRTVTADLDLQNQMVQKLSSVTRGAAKGVLTEWFSENNPVTRAKSGRLVSVQIKSIPLPVSQDAWRVEWRETVRNHSGVTQEVTDYEATMVVTVQPPKTDAEILKNPGGVYVTELSFGTVLAKNDERNREVLQ